jgi:hypothetical protein
MTFDVSDPDFEQRIRASFSRQRDSPHERTAGVDALSRVDATVRHPIDSVEAVQHSIIVSDDDDRGFPFPAQPSQEIHDGLTALGVQRPGRLVGQDDGRVVDHRARHGESLLLAA